MNRRHFLHISTGLLTISHPLSGFCQAEAVNFSVLAQTDLLSFLGDSDYICALGQTYLQRFPDEKHTSTLVSKLTASAVSEEATLALLKRRIENDFATGNTLLLKGWMLSWTEARQAALYSMLHS